MTDTERLAELCRRITPPATDDGFRTAQQEAGDRWAGRAKPPGSLGQVEAIGALVAGIVGTCPPEPPQRPVVIVFAGDHGCVADGASAWPSDVTSFMIRGMAAGGAAINAFAATVGAEIVIVDVGVAADVGDLPTAPAPGGIVHAKVRAGTDSLASGPAMSVADATAAVLVGADAAREAMRAGADLVVGGDMGIGNTTASTALIAHHLGVEPSAVDALVGPGAGSDAAGIETKTAIISTALARVAVDDEPLEVLAALGGLEIAALAGCYLAGAADGVPVIVDGVIALAALVVAEALAPGTAGRVVAGHRSTEPAASAALAHLGLVPVLDLDLRLGEGTGACLAVPVVQAACRALRDMADLPT